MPRTHTRNASCKLAPQLASLSCPTGPLRVPAVHDSSLGATLRLSLVVPTYNEAENISKLIDELEAVLKPLLGTNYELIVVDDDSPDGTWHIAEELMASHPRLQVLRRTSERGLSTAVV